MERLVLIKTRVGPQFVGPVRDVGESSAVQKLRRPGLRSGRQVTLRYLSDDAVTGGTPRMRGRGNQIEKQ